MKTRESNCQPMHPLARRQYKTSWLLALFMTIALGACYYDVEEEIYPMLGCDTADMSYQSDILPILVEHCYRCHDAANNFGNITLEGFDNLRQRVDSGQLLGAVKRLPGFSPMPQNEPPLLECDVEKIEAWIDQGAMNN